MITVIYVDLAAGLALNRPARVIPLNHPSPLVSNRGWVTTSNVAGIDTHSNPRGPVFWTKNGTRYVPAPTDDSLPEAKITRKKGVRP